MKVNGDQGLATPKYDQKKEHKSIINMICVLKSFEWGAEQNLYFLFCSQP